MSGEEPDVSRFLLIFVKSVYIFKIKKYDKKMKIKP